MTDLMTSTPQPGGPQPAPPRSPAGGGRAGFREALRSEWTKLRTVRSTVWTPLVMATLTVGIAVFVGATNSLQPDDTILGGGLTGAALGQLAAACFGVLVMSAEYSTGLIRTTLVACPRRGTVLAAKAVVTAVVPFVVGLLAGALAYQVGSVMLSGQGYAAGEPMPALLGVAVSFSAAGLLGLTAATILRHAAGAITAVIGVILLPSLLGPLLGSWQRWLVGATPLAALQKLSQTADATPAVAGSLGAWPTLWLVCASTAGALLAGGWLLRRRDA
jgi:ABC-2 type transport system permease protein